MCCPVLHQDLKQWNAAISHFEWTVWNIEIWTDWNLTIPSFATISLTSTWSTTSLQPFHQWRIWINFGNCRKKGCVENVFFQPIEPTDQPYRMTHHRKTATHTTTSIFQSPFAAKPWIENKEIWANCEAFWFQFVGSCGTKRFTTAQRNIQAAGLPMVNQEFWVAF